MSREHTFEDTIAEIKAVSEHQNEMRKEAEEDDRVKTWIEKNHEIFYYLAKKNSNSNLTIKEIVLKEMGEE